MRFKLELIEVPRRLPLILAPALIQSHPALSLASLFPHLLAIPTRSTTLLPSRPVRPRRPFLLARLSTQR